MGARGNDGEDAGMTAEGGFSRLRRVQAMGERGSDRRGLVYLGSRLRGNDGEDAGMTVGCGNDGGGRAAKGLVRIP